MVKMVSGLLKVLMTEARGIETNPFSTSVWCSTCSLSFFAKKHYLSSSPRSSLSCSSLSPPFPTRPTFSVATLLSLLSIEVRARVFQSFLVAVILLLTNSIILLLLMFPLCFFIGKHLWFLIFYDAIHLGWFLLF